MQQLIKSNVSILFNIGHTRFYIIYYILRYVYAGILQGNVMHTERNKLKLVRIVGEFEHRRVFFSLSFQLE